MPLINARYSDLLLVRCSAAAGLSLGEYAALVFAGAMSFEDGLKVRPDGKCGVWIVWIVWRCVSFRQDEK